MGECSVCSKGAAEFVDNELDKGTFLDDISAALALQVPPILIHRSSIHRHARKCYTLRARAARLKERQAARGEMRVFILWPENSLLGELAGRITSSDFDDADAIAPCQLRDSDVLLAVSFEERGQKPAQNQVAISHLEPEEPPGETMKEEKTEKEKPGILRTFVDKLLGRKPDAEAQTVETAPVERPPAPLSLEEIQRTCQHVIRDTVPGGRCELCGFQPARWQPPGISRAQFFDGVGRHCRF